MGAVKRDINLELELFKLLSKHVGERNAISQPEINAALGLPVTHNDPWVRANINPWRADEHAILSKSSNPPGYYFPEYVDEVERCIKSLENRIREQQAAVDGLRRYLARCDLPRDQGTLF